MKKLIAFLLVLIAVVFSSCNIYFEVVEGSGNVISKAVDVGDFTRVTIANNFNATIQYGPDCGIVITADDNLIESYVGVFKDNDTVTITLDPSGWFQNVTLEAVVTLPLLTELKASGNAIITMETDSALFGSSLVMETCDNASIDAELATGTLDLATWGNSTVSYAGPVSRLNIESGDNSTVNQSGPLDDAYVTGSGNTRIILEAPYITVVSIDLSDNCMMDIVSASTLRGSLEDNAWLNYSGSISHTDVGMEDNSGIGRDGEWF